MFWLRNDYRMVATRRSIGMSGFLQGMLSVARDFVISPRRESLPPVYSV